MRTTTEAQGEALTFAHYSEAGGPQKKSGVVPPHSKAGEAPAVAEATSGRSASSGKAAGRFGVRRHDAAFSSRTASGSRFRAVARPTPEKMWTKIRASPWASVVARTFGASERSAAHQDQRSCSEVRFDFPAPIGYIPSRRIGKRWGQDERLAVPPQVAAGRPHRALRRAAALHRPLPFARSSDPRGN